MDLYWVAFAGAVALIAAGLLVGQWIIRRTGFSLNKLVLIVAATVALSIVVVRLPENWEGVTPFEAVAVSVIDALQYFAADSSVEFPRCTLPDPFAFWFRFLYVVLYTAAPLCTATFLGSLVWKIFGQFRLSISSRRPVYYFSELNDRSMTLARELDLDWEQESDKSGKPLLVFCRITGDDMPLRAEAQKMGAVFCEEPIHVLQLPDPTRQQVRVFLIDNDEEANILTFLKMQDRFCLSGTTEENTKGSEFLVFSTLESAELVFDSILEQLDKKTLAYDLRLINETRLVTQKLLLEHPLYEAATPNGEKDLISVLVVGCGYLGTDIMKTAMLCGLMDSYEFRIQVIDQNAKKLEQQFAHDHPYLYRPSEVLENRRDGSVPAITPAFYQASVCTARFDRILERHCRQCNYIVITTGDDQLNVTTARYLQRWYARQAVESGSTDVKLPLMFAAVRSPERYDGLKTLEKEGMLHLFASNMEVYSAQGILDRHLDTVAAMLNCYYDSQKKVFDSMRLCNWNDELRKKSKRDLRMKPLVIQHSNQMAALHSMYKLQDLLHWNDGKQNMYSDLKTCDKKSAESVFPQLVHLVRKRGKLLYQLEHRRWTLFQALNGWDLYPKDKILARLKAVKKGEKYQGRPHKNEAARLHGCMIPYADLPGLAKEMHEILKSINEDFQGNDCAMCVASTFAWLEMRAGEKEAIKIRERLQAALKNEPACNTPGEMLEVMARSFDMKQK